MAFILLRNGMYALRLRVGDTVSPCCQWTFAVRIGKVLSTFLSPFHFYRTWLTHQLSGAVLSAALVAVDVAVVTVAVGAVVDAVTMAKRSGSP